MRLGQSELGQGRRNDNKLGKVKHKKLDAICEKAYSKSHSENNRVKGDEMEPRRSARVRKAPIMLDTSPPPVKKRRRIDSVKREDEEEEEEDSSGWKSRLRSMGRIKSRSVNSLVNEKMNLSPKGKRKLFDRAEESEEESEESEEEEVLKKSTVVKSQRPGRVKASNVLEASMEDDDDDTESSESEKEEEASIEEEASNEEVASIEEEASIEDDDKESIESEKEEEALMEDEDKESSENEKEEEALMEDNDDNKQSSEEQEMSDKEATLVSILETKDTDDTKVSEDNTPKEKSENEGEKLEKAMENDELTAQRDENGVNKIFEKLKTKEGRYCGLCGTRNEGKPPKKMTRDGINSEEEAYSGSSASEGPTYDIWDGFGEETGWLGRLLGPINDRFGIAGIWVHQLCAVWSPEVYFAGLGCLKNVRAALCRGRALKCSRCEKPGATIGCRVDRCPKTYHLPCARANSCIFDHKKFLIACTDHRHLFQPDGVKLIERIKKMKLKKIKLDVKKNSHEAFRKDTEAEEKWLENCGEDEEFLKRENKRLNRDLLRIAPVYIGGVNSPENLKNHQFGGWEAVAGLQNVIQCMKEVVILPLLYPEFFDNLGLTPPRGVLLHGYPGTGKTLTVRSLIGSCARGDKRIAYFARKGADCLGKYVGDSERQLRLLFQVAEKSQPSIIFFDEIDGLAPVRTKSQDQTHSSVVSTLLALMDGLKNRGSVIVIGATNRPEAVDPALRRPGRFDREIYFPLPNVKDREEILKLYTKKWVKPISGSLLKHISSKTVGFAGADLQALCTQAVIIALKRVMGPGFGPGLGQGQGPVIVEEHDWLEAFNVSPLPCSKRESGNAANNVTSALLHDYLVPCLLGPLCELVVSVFIDERVNVKLPKSVLKGGEIIKRVIVLYLEKKGLGSENWWAHVKNLVKEKCVMSEIEKGLKKDGVLIGNDDEGIEDGLLDVKTGFGSKEKLGFRVLISGNPRFGQRHIASCFLHYFIGNIEVQKVDLATISQEGNGDTVQGLTQILMRCASLSSCMIFMPRIDLWAIEILKEYDDDVASDKDDSDAEAADVIKSSFLWNSFIEQVDSICVNSPLMILATSELEFSKLPSRVKEFFKAEKSNSNFSVPQFLLEIDGKFDYNTVFNSCTNKLTKDLAKHFVQIHHNKNHPHSTPTVQLHTHSTPTIQLHPDVAIPTPIPKPSGPGPHVPSKGKKSDLLLAISTFGYQILIYPHFSELCWVTSKLKEGPEANIQGPWKGWPFNSCIVRPISGLSSGSGIVRGLIAIGLKAYRGEFNSLKEVAFNVRNVLELFMKRINEKIEGGKDKVCYIRLTSQIAYFEDLVFSWIHTLQRSFDLDTNLPSKATQEHEISPQSIAPIVNDSEIILEKSQSQSQSQSECVYNCCSECLINLSRTIKEILNVKRNCLGAEEVYDIVSSLSSKLHACVRRMCLSELKNVGTKCAKYCCKKNEGGVSMECRCHTKSKLTKSKEVDLSLTFRDGVLLMNNLGTDLNVVSHCNFKSLCLCSLIDIIVMSKE